MNEISCFWNAMYIGWKKVNPVQLTHAENYRIKNGIGTNIYKL